MTAMKYVFLWSRKVVTFVVLHILQLYIVLFFITVKLRFYFFLYLNFESPNSSSSDTLFVSNY